MSRYIVDVLVVFEKIYVSRSKCRRSYWYQLRIYLHWKQLCSNSKTMIMSYNSFQSCQINLIQ